MKMLSKAIAVLSLAGILSFGSLVPVASAAQDICFRAHLNSDGSVTLTQIPCPPQ